MEFRLLGPFEVRVDATPQPLAGRGERALLALLALSPGKAVAITTLIDALWNPGDLPHDPANALQLRVSKLRRTLSGLGASELVHRDGAGYRLGADPGDVDVYRFAGLIQSARGCGDAEHAVAAYDQALALWRAEPLVDFAGEAWTIVEAARLTELRLAAVGERAERMLTLGRYEQVAADLQPIVAEVPTRERLVGQLMTALFNAGRQAEALEVFTRTRRVLADELGIDPSRDLRAVMEQILRQDPAITPAPAAPPGIPRQRTGAHQHPRQRGNLPLRSTSFVGRAADLRRTLDLLGTSRLVTLAGAGGAGKTALGIEAARAVGGPVQRRRRVRAPRRGHRRRHARARGRRRARRQHRRRHRGPPAPRRAYRAPQDAQHAAGAGQLRAPHRAGRRPGRDHLEPVRRGSDHRDQP